MSTRHKECQTCKAFKRHLNISFRRDSLSGRTKRSACEFGVDNRLRVKSSPKAERLAFVTAAAPPPFEEAERAGLNGEAATVARRLFGQFMLGNLKS